MKTELIDDYHRWAERGYVSRLACKNHEYHDLLPVQGIENILLVCPRGDYSREVGKAEYLSIQRKVAMAEMLWRLR